jgi:hypothetical protein
MSSMPHDQWSMQNELLNTLQKAISQRTHGRLTGLYVDSVEGAIRIRASSNSYYGIQLAIGVIKEFTAEHPEAAPSKMSFSINGHTIVIGGTHRNLGKESATCAKNRQRRPVELPHPSQRQRF